MDFPEEANSILQNGILVETNKGVVCMSVNDALSSNLNLSVEELKLLATKLLLQNKDGTLTLNSVISDSDGFTSESSETCGVSSTTHMHPKVIFTSVNPKKRINTVTSPNETNIISILPISNSKVLKIDTNVSDSDVSVTTNNSTSGEKTSDSLSDKKVGILETNKLPTKKRGGWPKGRKRKPELLHLPPKAPATGYNLYLNDQRKLFKDSSLLFHEITKVIGNKWSSLSLEEKKPYLDKAEEEKKRYREELRAYRQSGAYQLYLANKRRKRAKYNVLSESDMDATDDFDEEDNEELYCRTCDQWFHNLHNKREHLQGRQHIQSIAGAISRELSHETDLGNVTSMSFSTSLDESSLDATPSGSGKSQKIRAPVESVSDSIQNVITAVARRELELKSLRANLVVMQSNNEAMYQQLRSLKEFENKLKVDLETQKETEKEMEHKVFSLWQVPSWFIITDLNPCTEDFINE